MKQELRIEIEVPDGFTAVYNGKTQKIDIVSEFPKSWKEFCKKYPVQPHECFVGISSDIFNACNWDKRHPVNDKFLFPNQETAEAVVALVQLLQLRNVYRKGWVPNYEDDEYKFIIKRQYNSIITTSTKIDGNVLTFQSMEIRDEFLKNFRDLIEKAKDLI